MMRSKRRAVNALERLSVTLDRLEAARRERNAVPCRGAWQRAKNGAHPQNKCEMPRLQLPRLLL